MVETGRVVRVRTVRGSRARRGRGRALLAPGVVVPARAPSACYDLIAILRHSFERTHARARLRLAVLGLVSTRLVRLRLPSIARLLGVKQFGRTLLKAEERQGGGRRKEEGGDRPATCGRGIGRRIEPHFAGPGLVVSRSARPADPPHSGFSLLPGRRRSSSSSCCCRWCECW
ncbi:hypothetical protein MPTK1_1g04620 [Marchantia polymorpha subsp. ruderalis]|uniref:Uncharacterized protein n=2 Tax=Marchantia polymorpha TaxID=3197 RepID=A0AAF6ALI1_MARPO|nr:hypothetical protein MARPO_0005s0145 [Marchantia polymorpha]BBM97301.1 hypothetical protein Mp_1g04620 [Marchantia polymorpha subsp. ruderalis]|eukprot:PTQ48505.1 hypothetical protein MARPO_0005s0145 [Marchantia polymorpha]